MDKPKEEVLEVLLDIRDTLNRIYTCFEDEYLEIQERRYGDKVKILEEMLTGDRRRAFPLLFGKRHLSQVEIAQAVGITQSAVSKFVNSLIKKDLIEQVEEAGSITYRDKYNLSKLF